MYNSYMKVKVLLLCLLVVSFTIMLFAFFHKSANPVFWIWSAQYFLLLVLSTGFLLLCAFLYLKADKLGPVYCIYILCIYIFSFFLADFIMGSINYYSRERSLDHPIYHHKLRPGKYKLFSSEGLYPASIKDLSVTSIGIRSHKEISAAKKKDHFRIMVLGDSFAEGVHVNDDETFCYLLEGRLNSSGKNRVEYEVLNCGVGSYVPLLEYLYLKTDGMKLDPDIVLLFFDMSDLWQTQEYLETAVKDRKGNVIRVLPPERSLSNKIYTFIRCRTYFVSHFIGLIAALGEKGSGVSEVTPGLLKFTLYADQEPWKDKWERIYEDIGLVSDLCREKNIPFAVVIYPWGHQVNGSEWALGRKACGITVGYTAPANLSYMLENKLKDRDISSLNLFPAFRDYKGDELLYYKKDIHWTKHGHRFVARHLFDFLTDILEKKR